MQPQEDASRFCWSRKIPRTIGGRCCVPANAHEWERKSELEKKSSRQFSTQTTRVIAGFSSAEPKIFWTNSMCSEKFRSLRTSTVKVHRTKPKTDRKSVV